VPLGKGGREMGELLKARTMRWTYTQKGKREKGGPQYLGNKEVKKKEEAGCQRKNDISTSTKIDKKKQKHK